MSRRLCTAITGAIALLLIYLVSSVAQATRERRSNRSALVVLSPDHQEIRVVTVPWLWSITFYGLNLIPHGRSMLVVLCFVGSFFSLNLVGVGLAFFCRGILEREYDSRGWIRL